jgi:hypothetical protein
MAFNRKNRWGAEHRSPSLSIYLYCLNLIFDKIKSETAIQKRLLRLSLSILNSNHELLWQARSIKLQVL